MQAAYLCLEEQPAVLHWIKGVSETEKEGGAGRGAEGGGRVRANLLERGEGCIWLSSDQAQLSFGNGHQCLLRGPHKLPPGVFYHLSIAQIGVSAASQP